MKLRKDQQPTESVQLLIKTAQSYLGYAADLGGRNVFGAKVGYDSQPWAGAFVDVCLREAGLKNLPSFTYTPAALAESIRSGNFSREPRPGSIALFNFSSNTGHAADAFGMPHCGIVTDVKEFTETGRFISIEGNVEGTGKYQRKDGVHQRIRSINEVVVFCTPVTGRQTFNGRLMAWIDKGRTKFNGEDLLAIDAAARLPLVIKLNTEIRHGDRSKKIETIQLALATVTDIRGAQPGAWDSITAVACARYQRIMGFVGKDVTGLPSVNTLRRLAKETGLFTLDA